MMRRKFFLKRFRQFFLMMLLPTLVVFAVCMFFVVQKSVGEVNASAKFSLESIVKNVENTISDSIYQNEMLTRSARSSKALGRILTGRVEEYSDLVFMNSIKDMLGSMVEAGGFIDSIYLCLHDRDYFFSSREGIRPIAGYYDDTWRAYCNQLETKTDVLIVPRVIHIAPVLDSIEVVSFFQRMILKDGTIVVNVDTAKFRQMLAEESYEYGGSIAVLDRDWNELVRLDESPGAGPEQAALAGYLRAGPEAAQGFSARWVSLGGVRYLCQAVAFAPFQMLFVSMIPLSEVLRVQGSYLLLFLLVLLTNCVIVTVLAYATTRRIFGQIHYMVDVFVDADRGVFPKEMHKKTNDEYDVIMNNIIHLFLNTTHLNTLLAEKQYRKETAELMALQLQINPHFLYNTLQTIDFEVARHDQDTALVRQMIQDLSGILKYALSNPEHSVTLAEELTHLRSYVAIQRVRFADSFVVYYEVDEGLEDAMVFSLMLQPLVENSILHGVRGKEGRGFIRVRATRLGDQLRISVLDNGVGMNPDQIQETERAICDESNRGIGLANVHRRLVLMFGDDAGLQIRSHPGIGTRVYFTIPYVKWQASQKMKKNPNE